jgi:hypothetical protein
MADALSGLADNMPGIQAAEDMRWIMAIGACLGGSDGHDYMEHLTRLAYEPDIQMEASKALQLMKAAENFGHTSRTSSGNEGRAGHARP